MLTNYYNLMSTASAFVTIASMRSNQTLATAVKYGSWASRTKIVSITARASCSCEDAVHQIQVHEFPLQEDIRLPEELATLYTVPALDAYAESSFRNYDEQIQYWHRAFMMCATKHDQ